MGENARIGTGRRQRDRCGVLMSQSLGQDGTTHGANLIVGTGGGRSLGVPQGIHKGVGVAVVTAITGVEGIALLGAGGGDDEGGMLMPQRRGQKLSADRTMDIGQTVRLPVGGVCARLPVGFRQMAQMARSRQVAVPPVCPIGEPWVKVSSPASPQAQDL